MSGIQFWEDDPGTTIGGQTLTQWDVLKLTGPQGTATIFGISRVTPTASVERQLEDVPGEDGGIPLNFRYKPLRAKVEISIWTKEQLDKLNAIIRLWGPNRAREVAKLEPQHPFFDLFEVNEVYILDITADPPTSRDGMRFILTLEEYWAQKKPPAQAASSDAPLSGSRISANDVLGTPTTVVAQRPSDTTLDPG